MTHQTFVFVNGNDFPVVFTWVIRMVASPASAPRRAALLSSVLTRSEVNREDSHTLVVTSEGGFLAHQLDRLLASSTRSFAVSELIERPDYAAEVRRITEAGRPDQVAFRFRRELEDPSYRWLFWKDGWIVEFPLPRVGESAIVAGPLFRRKRPH